MDGKSFVCCFLVFNFELYILQRCFRKVATSYVIGTLHSSKGVRGCGQPSGIFGVPEGIGNSLANLLKCVRVYWLPSDKFLRGHW
jgi:hypothetical protein